METVRLLLTMQLPSLPYKAMNTFLMDFTSGMKNNSSTFLEVDEQA